MEELFKELSKNGGNSSEGIAKWIKDSNLLPAAGTDAVMKLCKSVKDNRNVGFDEFKNIITGLAKDKTTVDKFTDKLKKTIPQLKKMFSPKTTTVQNVSNVGNTGGEPSNFREEISENTTDYDTVEDEPQEETQEESLEETQEEHQEDTQEDTPEEVTSEMSKTASSDGS